MQLSFLYFDFLLLLCVPSYFITWAANIRFPCHGIFFSPSLLSLTCSLQRANFYFASLAMLTRVHFLLIQFFFATALTHSLSLFLFSCCSSRSIINNICHWHCNCVNFVHHHRHGCNEAD